MNIGTDYNNYVEDVYSVTEYKFGEGTQYQYEYFYLFVCRFIQTFHLDTQWLFVIYSIVSITLLFNVFKNRWDLLPFAIVWFFLSFSFTFSINGIRQAVAILCFLNTIKYLKEDYSIKHSFLGYAAWACFGFINHTSYIFVLLLWPLRLISSKLQNISGLTLCLIASAGVLFNLTGLSMSIIPRDLFFGSYSEVMNSDFFKTEAGGFSFGHIISVIFYLLPLVFYNRITDKYNEAKIYYLIFAIGVFIYFLVLHNLYFARMAYYFLFSELLVYPYMIRYVIETKDQDVRMVSIAAFLILLAINLNSIPDFFSIQVWPNAKILGIGIN